MSEFNFSPDLSSDEGRVSYGIGRQLGGQLRDNPPPGVSLAAILAGVTDAFNGQASRVSEAELSASFKVIRDIMQAEAQAKAEAAAGAGLEFLAENAKRDGITVLASGLQYEVLTAGEGAKPSREDTVRTHYHGTLIDGSVFDSSYERGEPAEFPVGGVIAGWTEALQLMNAGSKWRLYVPSELAYGAQGVGSIPPHSVLVFDVELLDVL
ncbi:MAG: FKBP-type peptidyl-prolyl cis-trans isomerase [Pseudomonas sp.]|uniref:FKBP-type peptidyl-prolyl cis-trans isomerase n=1 Tax=Pseudomonas sp. TaxID=306 RepID=UPI003D0A27A1